MAYASMYHPEAECGECSEPIGESYATNAHQVLVCAKCAARPKQPQQQQRAQHSPRLGIDAHREAVADAVDRFYEGESFESQLAQVQRGQPSKPATPESVADVLDKIEAGEIPL